MATRKTVTKTVQKKLPTTVKLPGGQASMFGPGDIPPRNERPLRVALMATNFAKVRRLATAQRILNESGETLDASGVLPGDDVVFTAEEAEQFLALNEIASVAFLKSWTLTEAHTNGETTTLSPRPIPTTVDEFLDLPRNIYDPIVKAAATILADYMESQDGFTVDGGAGDDDSPTGL